MADFESYLADINFEKYFKKLKKKLKNKKIIIYGTGSMFQYIQEKYDFSNLDIIGISDMKFLPEQEGENCLGYKIIPKDKMKDYNPDVVLIAIQNYISVIEDFVLNVFDKTNTKVYPLARIGVFDMLKEIWRR